MSQLTVLTYPDERRANEALIRLRQVEETSSFELEDAVVVVKDVNDHIKVHQTNTKTSYGAIGGTLAGILVGSLVLMPIAGAAVGAAAGALAGKHRDLGIEDDFIRKLSEELQPGSSALFVLVRESNWSAVKPLVAEFGGTLLYTTISSQAERKLQATLRSGKKAETQARLPLDAEVVCSDGNCGHISKLLISPSMTHVTHIIVRESSTLGIERVIPIGMVEQDSGAIVRLNMTLQQFSEQQLFEFTIQDDQTIRPEVIMPDSPQSWGYSPSPDALHELTVEQIPDGDLAIQRGDDIEATDGHIGEIEELRIDPSHHTITHLILRGGHFWAKQHVLIPFSEVERVADGTIYLKSTKAELASIEGASR